MVLAQSCVSLTNQEAFGMQHTLVASIPQVYGSTFVENRICVPLVGSVNRFTRDWARERARDCVTVPMQNLTMMTHGHTHYAPLAARE